MTSSTPDDGNGLPLPTVPYHFPPVPGPKPVPDSTGCTPVKDLIAGALEMGHRPTENWNADIAAAGHAADSQVPRSPVPQRRIGQAGGPNTTPGYFQGEDRSIDHLGDGVKGTAGALAAFFTHPVGTAVHDIYGARINAWQKEFRKDHRIDLAAMSRVMGKVDDQCEAMRTVADQVATMEL